MTRSVVAVVAILLITGSAARADNRVPRGRLSSHATVRRTARHDHVYAVSLIRDLGA
jgi:hypothetical protein